MGRYRSQYHIAQVNLNAKLVVNIFLYIWFHMNTKISELRPPDPLLPKKCKSQLSGSWQAGESPQAGPTCIYRRYDKGYCY